MANCTLCGKTVETNKYVQFRSDDARQYICLNHDEAEVAAALADQVDVTFNPPTRWRRVPCTITRTVTDTHGNKHDIEEQGSRVETLSAPPLVKRLRVTRGEAVAEYVSAKVVASRP